MGASDIQPPTGVARRAPSTRSSSALAAQGALERIEAEHELTVAPLDVRVDGIEVGGTFTPVAGFDRATVIRRPVLDQALLDVAVDAGAATRFGEKVVGLVGVGTGDEPVTGVTLASGEEIHARRVFGADGRASTVATRLGLEKTRPLAGEQSVMFAYWRGLPPFEVLGFDARPSASVTYGQAEDGIGLLVAMLPAQAAHGSPAERERRYRDTLARFPEVVDPLFAGIARDAEVRQGFVDAFARGTRPYSDVITPERMERWYSAPSPGGFDRGASVGDSVAEVGG